MYSNLLNNFELYISQINKQDFLVNIVNNKEFSKFLIDNKLFWKHFPHIRRLYGEDTCCQIIKLLCVEDKENKFITPDIYIIFEYDYLNKNIFESIFYSLQYNNSINIKNLIEYCLLYKCNYINCEFIDYLLSSQYKNIVINNFEKIMDNCYYLLDVKKIIKDKTLLEEYNNYINKKPDNMIYEILIKGFDLPLDKIKDEKIFDTLKQIIKEILEFEKLNYSDIDFIGSGAYSFVVSIGSKVLKLGQKRQIFKMNNNKRFLKPILRTEIKKLTSNEILGCVEITEKVSTKNITEKDIYILYKELRDEGYIWADCRKCNAGRLVKDNKIYFNDLDPTLSAINYNNDNREELKEGELVIIDNDYIFSEEQFESLPKKTQYNYLESIEKYENKYQHEMNGRKK